MDEFIDIEPSACIFYHSLCELKHEELQLHSHERLLPRKNIRLLTYNIFLRPPPVKNNESDWKDERLEDFCKYIHNYDIICLQEMFGAFNSRKQSLIRAATKSGFFFYVDTSSPSFLSKYLADGGLVILSRFPIVAFSFTQFRYGVIADSLSQKGLLYAKILVKDCFLHLFTSHLQASYMDSGEFHFQVSCETRMAQIGQINSMMSDILKTEYQSRDTVILVGDFNVDAQKYKYKKPQGLTAKNLFCIEKEYDDMVNALNGNDLHTRDVFRYHKNYNPITYGDKDPETGMMETVLTHVEDHGSRQSLDYIFECFWKKEIKALNEIANENDPNNNTDNSSCDEHNKTHNSPITTDDKKNQNERLIIDTGSLKIEKFLINQVCSTPNESSRKLYSQLSDHYGLSCEIVYQRPEGSSDKQSDQASYIVDDMLNDEQKKLLEFI